MLPCPPPPLVLLLVSLNMDWWSSRDAAGMVQHELCVIDTRYDKHYKLTKSRLSAIVQDIFCCDIVDSFDFPELLQEPASDANNFVIKITPNEERCQSCECTPQHIDIYLQKSKVFVYNNYNNSTSYHEKKIEFSANSLVAYCANALIWMFALDITIENETKLCVRADNGELNKKLYDECYRRIVPQLLNCEKGRKIPLSRQHEVYNEILTRHSVPPRLLVPGLRHIILDVSNIAMVHGRDSNRFSWRGVQIAYSHFKNEKGHDQMTLICPYFRKHRATNMEDAQIIKKFESEGVLKYTQSRTPSSSAYDDRFMLQLASTVGGVIVSNDKFTDLATENPTWRTIAKDFVISYIFVKDVFLLAMDPQGRDGEKLHRVLRNFDPKTFCCSSAALFCKFGDLCNYGKKCRYSHRQPKENKRSRSKKDAVSLSSSNRSDTVSQVSDASSGGTSTSGGGGGGPRSDRLTIDSSDNIRGDMPFDMDSSRSFRRRGAESPDSALSMRQPDLHPAFRHPDTTSLDSRDLHSPLGSVAEMQAAVNQPDPFTSYYQAGLNSPARMIHSPTGNMQRDQIAGSITTLSTVSSLEDAAAPSHRVRHRHPETESIAESGYASSYTESVRSAPQFRTPTGKLLKDSVSSKLCEIGCQTEEISPLPISRKLLTVKEAKDPSADTIAAISAIYPIDFVISLSEKYPEEVKDRQKFCYFVAEEFMKCKKSKESSNDLSPVSQLRNETEAYHLSVVLRQSTHLISGLIDTSQKGPPPISDSTQVVDRQRMQSLLRSLLNTSLASK